MQNKLPGLSLSVLLAAGSLLVASAASAETYLIIGKGDLPSDLAEQVAAADGVLKERLPFNVAVASSSNPDFADSIDGVRSVVADAGFDVKYPSKDVKADFGVPPNSGDDDFFFDLQWGPNYVGAQAAWDAGTRGAGVRVAVLDSGFDLDHPDIAPNLNLTLSKDFTGEGLQYGLPDVFSHGTHVAGTIAGADNGFGIIGVAPEAELVLVKVLSDTGSGYFANIIAGIYYAAAVDADVINMSLGAFYPRQIDGVTELAVAANRAVTYAYQQGTTVIVSAGNDANDLDGDGSNVRFITGVTHNIGISALTTLNWAGDPDQDLVPASYTNYGTSMVDFSAPGGSGDYTGNEVCTVAGLTRPCWVFDLVFSSGNGGWYWSAGTSMAAPHAAGVAALIISESGRKLSPAQVEKKMRVRSLDFGQPGRDDFYGHGLVNSGY